MADSDGRVMFLRLAGHEGLHTVGRDGRTHCGLPACELEGSAVWAPPADICQECRAVVVREYLGCTPDEFRAALHEVCTRIAYGDGPRRAGEDGGK